MTSEGVAKLTPERSAFRQTNPTTAPDSLISGPILFAPSTTIDFGSAPIAFAPAATPLSGGPDSEPRSPGEPVSGKVLRIGNMVFKNDVLNVDPAARADARVVEVWIDLDDPTLTERTWVLITESPDGGWGVAGHANTGADIAAAARAELAKG